MREIGEDTRVSARRAEETVASDERAVGDRRAGGAMIMVSRERGAGQNDVITSHVRSRLLSHLIVYCTGSV